MNVSIEEQFNIWI